MYSPRLAKFPCLTLVRCFHTRVTSSMLPRFLLHHLFVTGSMLPSLQRVPSSSLVPWYEVYNTSSVCHRFHATRDTFGSMWLWHLVRHFPALSTIPLHDMTASSSLYFPYIWYLFPHLASVKWPITTLKIVTLAMRNFQTILSLISLREDSAREI